MDPNLEKWSYLDWYKQIQSAAKEQSGNLVITKETEWVNTPETLKLEILEEYNDKNT